MADTDWGAFTDQPYPLDTDILVATRGAGGINLSLGGLLHLDASGNWKVGGSGLFSSANNITQAIGAGTLFNTGGAAIAMRGITTGYNDGGIEFYAGAGATGFERMRINSSGQVIIGATTTWSSSELFESQCGNNAWAVGAYHNGSGGGGGGAMLVRVNNAVSALAAFYYGTAQVGLISTNGTSTSYGTTSDYRMKSHFRPLEDPIGKLKALNPGTFEWKVNGETTDGFLAHEFGKAIPGAATGKKDGMREETYVDEETGKQKKRKVPDYQGIDQSKAVPLLVAALQEAIARIEALEAKIAGG
ncbi:hypothetical protein BH10PSE12_BH10PSE12_02590 [soil metagenome]